MIKPTIGRQAWFWKFGSKNPDVQDEQPEAATVCYVWNDRMVNLQVIDRNGAARAETSVNLRQPEDDELGAFSTPFCEWMPFQVATAGK